MTPAHIECTTAIVLYRLLVQFKVQPTISKHSVTHAMDVSDITIITKRGDVLAV